MARLTIELPSELSCGDQAASDRAATGSEAGYRADGVDAATEGVDAATDAFVDWVDCWTGA